MRSRWIFLTLVLVALSAGCMATKSARGVHEPDLTIVRPSAQRSGVESKLGKPLWRAGSVDGSTYDVYQYKAARRGHPKMAPLVFGIDILSLGTLELLAAANPDKDPLKQIAVAYDDADRAPVPPPRPCVERRDAANRARNPDDR